MPEANTLTLLRSPLHDFDLPSRAATPGAENRVLLCELPHLAYLVLRGQADDAAFMQAVAAVLGQSLPTQPMALLATTCGVVLWCSPDEWLLVCKRSGRDALLENLGAALRGVFAQVVDNSGGLGMLRLAGPDHLLLLRQLSPYDFTRLGVGRCVHTVAAKASLTVARSDEAGVLLLFRRSFADYLWRLIERTAQPYRPGISAPGHCADPWFAPLLEGGWRAS